MIKRPDKVNKQWGPKNPVKKLTVSKNKIFCIQPIYDYNLINKKSFQHISNQYIYILVVVLYISKLEPFTTLNQTVTMYWWKKLFFCRCEFNKIIKFWYMYLTISKFVTFLFYLLLLVLKNIFQVIALLLRIKFCTSMLPNVCSSLRSYHCKLSY